MKIILIYNSKSGGKYTLCKLRKLCQAAGIKIEYSFPITNLRSRKLATLIAQGCIVAVAGGDGTINAVAAKLVGTDSTLLPLPAGTLNHFSKDIGMASTVEEVIARAQEGKSIRVDVAYCNDQLFINNSSIGFYSLGLVDRERSQSYVGKWPAALLAAARQIVRFHRYRLVINGIRVRSPFVFVGNNEYKLDGLGIPLRSSLSSGRLNIFLAKASSRIALFHIAWAIIVGRTSQAKEFDISFAKNLTIDSPREHITVSYDGEVKRMTPPLIYKLTHRGLNVLRVTEK